MIIAMKIIVSFFNLIYCINCELVIKEALHGIHFNGKLVNLTTSLRLFNNDSSNKENITELLYEPDPQLNNCHTEFKYTNEVPLKISGKSAKLKSPLRSSDSIQIYVTQICVNNLHTIAENRKVTESEVHTYKGNLHFYTTYKILSEKTYIFVQRNLLIDINMPPTKVRDKFVLFESNNLSPYSTDTLIFRYFNYKPVLVVSKLNRIIDVSHYGMIKIIEEIEVRHAGSKLAEPFSSHFLNDRCTSVSLPTFLPVSAQKVRVFDAIGLIYSWSLKYRLEDTVLLLKPRYRLTGGWKTAYTQEYLVPTYEYLFHDSDDNYVLKIRILDHVANSTYTENVKVTILLPEGAKVKTVNHPEFFNSSVNFVTSGDEKMVVTSSVTNFGRPAVSFEGSNLNEMHISDAVVEYTYPKLYLLRVPFVLAAYFEAGLLLFIFFVRLQNVSINS